MTTFDNYQYFGLKTKKETCRNASYDTFIELQIPEEYKLSKRDEYSNTKVAMILKWGEAR